MAAAVAAAAVSVVAAATAAVSVVAAATAVVSVVADFTEDPDRIMAVHISIWAAGAGILDPVIMAAEGAAAAVS